MDDKTAIICAAMLCMLGVSLSHMPGSGASSPTAHRPPAEAVASASPAFTAVIDMRDQSTLRAARSLVPAN